jgi:hypothetical protein
VSGPLPGDASLWPPADAATSNASSGHPAAPGPGAGMEDSPPAVIFLVNATRTSAGSGPGPVQVPAAEAAALVAAKLAIYGDQPPRGWPG